MQKKIDEDINNALKRGDKATANALRFLKSVLINNKITLGHDLSDNEVIKVIRKEIKLRIEARDMYASNGRNELAAKEEFERGLYALYVPDQLNEEQLLKIIVKTAKDIEGPVDFAQLMPKTMKVVAGQADGKLVAETVKKYLNGGCK